MNRVELRLRVFEALIAIMPIPDCYPSVDAAAHRSVEIADILDPPRNTPPRDAKGRFSSATAEQAFDDEESRAMAQALPDDRHHAVDPFAPLRSFDAGKGTI